MSSSRAVIANCLVLPMTVGFLLVAMSVGHVAGMETFEVICRLMVATVSGESAVVAIARIKRVVDVAVEAARTVEPGTGSDEDAAVEPLGAVVAIG